MNRSSRRNRLWRRLSLCGLLVLVATVIVGAGYGASVILIRPQTTSAAIKDSKTAAKKNTAKTATLDKLAVRNMLANLDANQMTAKTINLEANGNRYRVETTIDKALQQTLVDKLCLEHARYLGIVVLDPTTGEILTMISHDRADPKRNICVNAGFPAASIFKIITASAAIEALELNPNSTLLYNGHKHTLYKRQIKEHQNKYTRRITFEDAFAQSINPVFGKLGANRLGKEKLLAYAQAFGFNHQFDLDFQMVPSQFAVADTPYQWAEIASGFNKDTTLSPLHGAIIAATIVNTGKLIEPTLIDSVTDENGQVVYRGHVRTFKQAITAHTAQVVSKLMRATIREGTARKVFRGYQKDRVLSKLDLGGKTGSINNDPRYDWFVGFAKDKNGSQSVVVSVLVAHEKFIGIKSGQYAQMAVKAYFENYFTKQAASVTDRQSSKG